jgi:hypothetical protein
MTSDHLLRDVINKVGGNCIFGHCGDRQIT